MMWSTLAAVRATSLGQTLHAHGLPADADPRLLVTASVSDLVTAFSYFAIALSLVVLVVRVRDALPFGRIFLLFGAFIVLCGGTHLVAVAGFSSSAPRLATAISVATAVVSLWTAVLVPGLIPRVRQLARGIAAGRDADRAQGRAAALEEMNAALTEQACSLTELNSALATSLEHRLALEAQLRQAQKMEVLGRMAGGVAHDFNNLLTVIHLNLHFAQEAGAGEPDLPVLAEALSEAANASASASALTQRLLQFGRREDLRAQPVSIDQQLRADQRLFRSALRSGVRVQYDLDSAPAEVVADATDLQQAVLNLLLNAADAMPEGSGDLRVRTQRCERTEASESTVPVVHDGPYVALSVEDNGSGMSEAVLSRVFEPFYTTKGEGQGTGLGLSMVYDTMERMRGGVSARSTLGVGSTFTLWLPVATEQRLLRERAPSRAA